MILSLSYRNHSPSHIHRFAFGSQGGKRCSVEGCNTSAKQRGLCWRHGTYVRARSQRLCLLCLLLYMSYASTVRLCVDHPSDRSQLTFFCVLFARRSLCHAPPSLLVVATALVILCIRCCDLVCYLILGVLDVCHRTVCSLQEAPSPARSTAARAASRAKGCAGRTGKV